MVAPRTIVIVGIVGGALGLAGCSDAALEPNEPVCDANDGFAHCSPEELEAAVADLGGKQDGLFTYRSEYTNVVLVGATASGEEVVAIIGTHSVDYPYVGGAPWDNILLQVGERQLTRTDADIEGLALVGFGGDEPQLVLEDHLLDEAGDPVSVRLHWSLHAISPGSRFLGLWPLGLRWHPSHLSGADPLDLEVDGQPHMLAALRGVSETGDLLNLQDDDFAVMYDALFVVSPPDEPDPFVYVDIATRTLPSSKKSSVLDPLLAKRARVALTASDDGLVEANAREITVPDRDDESVVRFEDVHDAGPALVRRQVVELADADGRPLLGLRDVFLPR